MRVWQDDLIIFVGSFLIEYVFLLKSGFVIVFLFSFYEIIYDLDYVLDKLTQFFFLVLLYIYISPFNNSILLYIYIYIYYFFFFSFQFHHWILGYLRIEFHIIFLVRFLCSYLRLIYLFFGFQPSTLNLLEMKFYICFMKLL